RVALVGGHRQVEQPRRLPVPADPQLTRAFLEVLRRTQRQDRSGQVGPDAQLGPEVREQGRQVRAEEGDVDVLVLARLAEERIDCPAADDPPAHAGAIEDLGSLAWRHGRPRPVPAKELLVRDWHLRPDSVESVSSRMAALGPHCPAFDEGGRAWRAAWT